MIESIRSNKNGQLALGLLFGIIFGVFLQKAGVTTYKVIINQLLLTDFTVLKVMMSAVVVGTFGIHIMNGKGVVNLHIRGGSYGSTVVGGLIFGAGFALLGYCPGTVAGAVGQGSMDALVGGVAGLMFGSWVYAVFYPQLLPFRERGKFKNERLQDLFHLGTWQTIIPVTIIILVIFAALEWFGL
ncbi:MAG: YeeE/YedE family protein [Dehalococcoidia bacterium]|nr:YeeE/YedE family protein [Dehalococcoidia bacterium]